MQNLKLPITLDPNKSAQRRLECEGIILFSDLARLCVATNVADGQVSVSLKFGLDEQNLIFIQGRASTNVTLTCQRCSDDFSMPVEVEFCFSPVRNEEAAEMLPSHYDAIELDENGEVNLRTLVEDELILALPLIPKHDSSDCGVPGDSTWGELPEELSKTNPFDVLKQLK